MSTTTSMHDAWRRGEGPRRGNARGASSRTHHRVSPRGERDESSRANSPSSSSSSSNASATNLWRILAQQRRHMTATYQQDASDVRRLKSPPVDRSVPTQFEPFRVHACAETDGGDAQVVP
jgi:hypothetical protein